MLTPSTAGPLCPEGGCERDRPTPDRLLLDLIIRTGRDPGIPPPSKAVFLAVVAHAAERGVCTASDQDLATDSRTSIPTVQRALKLCEGGRLLRRSYRPHDAREIRLLTGEQSLVVDSINLQQQKQQHDEPAGCSPVRSPGHPEQSECVNHVDTEVERLIALLTAWKITAKVARVLVRDFPGRIVPQVEAHRHRQVKNPPAALVTAIRDDWPTTPPECRRPGRAALDAHQVEPNEANALQAATRARQRAEDERVRAYWEALDPQQRQAFEDEAVEASEHRDLIRQLGPNAPMVRGHRAAARREHIQRTLGLEIRD